MLGALRPKDRHSPAGIGHEFKVDPGSGAAQTADELTHEPFAHYWAEPGDDGELGM